MEATDSDGIAKESGRNPRSRKPLNLLLDSPSERALAKIIAITGITNKTRIIKRALHVLAVIVEADSKEGGVYIKEKKNAELERHHFTV